MDIKLVEYPLNRILYSIVKNKYIGMKTHRYVDICQNIE